MKNIKKALFMVTVGLIGSTTVAVTAASHSSIFSNSFAGGTVIDGDNRTTTFDGTTPLTIDPVTNKGSRTVGNIGAYSPNCSAADGCIATIGNKGIIFYCATAKEGDYYKGFYYTVSRCTFTFNGGASNIQVTASWGKTTGNDDSISGYGSGAASTFTVESNTKNQAFSLDDSSGFLRNQSSAKTALDSKPCIYLYVKSSDKTIDLISAVIEYSCKS